MKKKVFSTILFVLCAAQFIGFVVLANPSTPIWVLFMAFPPLLTMWFLDVYCNCLDYVEEEEGGEQS